MGRASLTTFLVHQYASAKAEQRGETREGHEASIQSAELSCEAFVRSFRAKLSCEAFVRRFRAKLSCEAFVRSRSSYEPRLSPLWQVLQCCTASLASAVHRTRGHL